MFIFGVKILTGVFILSDLPTFGRCGLSRNSSLVLLNKSKIKQKLTLAMKEIDNNFI